MTNIYRRFFYAIALMIFVKANSYAQPTSLSTNNTPKRQLCNESNVEFPTQFGKEILNRTVNGAVTYNGTTASVKLKMLLSDTSGRTYDVELTEQFVCNGQWIFEKVVGEYTERSVQKKLLPEDVEVDLWGYPFTGVYLTSTAIRYKCNGTYHNRTRTKKTVDYYASGVSNPQTISNKKLKDDRSFTAAGHWKADDPDSVGASFTGSEYTIINETSLNTKQFQSTELHSEIDKPEPEAPLFISALREFYSWFETSSIGHTDSGKNQAQHIVAGIPKLSPSFTSKRSVHSANSKGEPQTKVYNVHYTPTFKMAHGAWELVKAKVKKDFKLTEIATQNGKDYTKDLEHSSILSVDISGVLWNFDYWFASQTVSNWLDGSPDYSTLAIIHDSSLIGLQREYERDVIFPLNGQGSTFIKMLGYENYLQDHLLRGNSENRNDLNYYQSVGIMKSPPPGLPFGRWEYFYQKLQPEVKERVKLILNQAKTWERGIPDELDITGNPKLIEVLFPVFGVN